jgi:hypothetical protein
MQSMRKSARVLKRALSEGGVFVGTFAKAYPWQEFLTVTRKNLYVSRGGPERVQGSQQ